MPRSRGSSEMAQRQSPRAPLHLKTTACSESNGVHRPTVDRSPKLDDRRSSRSPLHEKKRGTRVADLETKLGQAQGELKKLKEQLASAEASKRDAQQQLEETKKQIPVFAPQDPENDPPSKDATTHHPNPQENSDPNLNELPVPVVESIVQANSPATDVFEVVPTVPLPKQDDDDDTNNNEDDQKEDEKEEERKLVIEDKGTEEKVVEKEEEEEEEEENKREDSPESPEILELRSMLAEKEKELETHLEEKESLKKHAAEAAEHAAAARSKEEELGVKLGLIGEELRESKAKAEHLGKQLEAMEGAKAALETEMKKLRIQTEQWRKAADAAAAVLAAGGGMETEMNGRVTERCGSMDKHLSGARYEVGSGGFVGLGSPLMAGEMEEGLNGGKRKGGGIRMFGDLWKKKGQHK